jgi:type IV pilus assembly protein PilX
MNNFLSSHSFAAASGIRRRPTRPQSGASLIMVMLILIVVSALGIGAVQISMMSERGARNDRDMQVAWQASEAALMDAEFDIRGPLPSVRRSAFGSNGAPPDRTLLPLTGCGTSGWSTGLCALVDEGQAALNVKQSWLTVDFEIYSNSAPTAAFGSFTGQQQYPSGVGVRPARAPRYVIEPIRDYWDARDKSAQADARYMYRVTAMGFGPRDDIQAVSQMLVRP